jgi:hypothetical protein
LRIFRHLQLVIFLLLVSLFVLGFHPVQAQQLASASVTEFAVTTLDGKPVRDEVLMAGTTYRINFAIEAAAGLKEKCVLKTDLIRTFGLDRFWSLKGNYAGIDSSTWQPGSPTITFEAVAGKAELVLEGTVPEDWVSKTLEDGQTLHLAKNIALVELALESGTVIASRQLEVIDGSIESYRNALATKREFLAGVSADQTYINMANSMIANAEANAKIGYTDMAMESLNAIPSSGWVKPQASTSYQWIIIGILAVIAAASVFLLLRARSETGFIKRQTDSQAKRLQVLAMKASRVGDPALTEGIQQVRKELEQAVGGN